MREIQLRREVLANAERNDILPRLIATVNRSYRQAAEQQVGEEYPEVREAILNDKIKADRAMVPMAAGEAA